MSLFPVCVLFVQRSVVLAGSEVCALLVHSECIPCCRTEDLFFRNVVHTNRNTKHRAHGDQVCTNVAIADGTVVCAPVVHHIVSSLERAFFAIASGSEPGAGPCIVGTFPQFVCYFIRKMYGPAFCDLQNRSHALLQGSDGSW